MEIHVQMSVQKIHTAVEKTASTFPALHLHVLQQDILLCINRRKARVNLLLFLDQ